MSTRRDYVILSDRGEGKRRKTKDSLSAREAVLVPSLGVRTREEDAEEWRKDFEDKNPGLKAVVG